jgi:hypothetical protein
MEINTNLYKRNKEYSRCFSVRKLEQLARHYDWIFELMLNLKKKSHLWKARYEVMLSRPGPRIFIHLMKIALKPQLRKLLEI